MVEISGIKAPPSPASEPVTPPWRVARLGDLAEVTSGGTPRRDNPDNWGGTIPWLTTSAVNFGIISDQGEPITEEGLRDSAARLLPPGSLLMAMYGQGKTRGRVGILAFEAAINQACAAIIPKPGVSTKYLFYSLMARYEEIRGLSQGGNQLNLNADLIRSIRLPIPITAEQEAVAEVLDCADSAAREVQALIEKKEAAKTAVAEELLTGRRRFPGFTAPWREQRLGDFFAPKDDRAPTQTPVILSCSKVYGIIPQSERFSKQLASMNNAHYKHVLPGDLVYDPMLLWDASIAFSSYEGIVSPAYETLAWMGDEVGDRRFFKALFRTDAMKYIYKTISQGTNARRRKAPVSDFLRVGVRLPEAQEQSRIAGVLELLEEEITLLRRQRDLLNEQRKGLMQKLLTGEVRLKEFRT